jgi:hypothetical protein
MLNLIRNNFLKGCLVRFLTDFATQIEKWQQQNLPGICQRSKERKLYLRSSIHPRKRLFKQLRTNFRFNRILIMNAHALNDLTHMDPKDVVSAGGKLIIGSPYNN